MDVLFIDDSQAILEIAGELIVELGHQVITEISAVKVVENFKTYNPDVIITDMLMPKITGIDLLKYVNEHNPGIPVVLATGHSDINSAIAAIRLGAFDYLMKPITYDALQACLLRLEKNVQLNKRLSGEKERRIKYEAELEARKKVQKELEEKNLRLEELTLSLKKHQSQLVQSEKMAAIGLLTAGVAHEINNPVSFIKTNLGVLNKYKITLKDYLVESKKYFDSLQELPLSEDGRKALAKIDFISSDLDGIVTESLEGAERIHEIVQNLKDFAREDTKQPKDFNINEGIESTLKIIWNELKYKCKVEKEFGSLPLIKCYGGELNQVFMNILVNAAHAIEKEGTVRIRTWEEDGNIIIQITDNGCGIPEENINQIFNPFFTTKEKGKGTGLGLSISYRIIEKHNGRINVESKVGKGTRFTIFIPIS